MHCRSTKFGVDSSSRFPLKSADTRFGVAVVSFVALTKLLYVESG